MKKIFLPSIIFFVVLTAGVVLYQTADAKKINIADVNLSGQVIDMTSGEPLTGVEIEIEGSDKKVYTDFDGNFNFDNLKPGDYNIIASYISYDKSYVENLSLRTNEDLEIQLQASR